MKTLGRHRGTGCTRQPALRRRTTPRSRGTPARLPRALLQNTSTTPGHLPAQHTPRLAAPRPCSKTCSAGKSTTWRGREEQRDKQRVRSAETPLTSRPHPRGAVQRVARPRRLAQTAARAGTCRTTTRKTRLFSCNNARNPICACVSMTPGEGARPGSPRCLAKQRERAAPLTRSKQPPRERLASRGRSLHAWPRAQAARTTLPSPKNHPASAAAVPRPCALAMPRRPSGRQRPLAPVVVLGTELNTATSRARCVIKMRCKDHVVSKSSSLPALN